MTDDTSKSEQASSSPDADFDEPTGRRGFGGRSRRGFGKHHVHHVHVHHHGHGRGRRGPGRRGLGSFGPGSLDTEGRIERLEQIQRDLEQEVADVAAKIARLRDRAAQEAGS